MKSAVINIKTQPELKIQAQEIAGELGVSLSAILNGFLKHLVRTKKVTFSTDEEPSKYLINAMKQAEKNYKEGNTSPAFKTGKEAVKWLEDQGI